MEATIVAGDDPEVTAIGQVLAALGALDDDEARARVIDYVAKRHKVKVVGSGGGRASARLSGTEEGDDAADQPRFRHFSDLMDATFTPSTDADRALIGGYWAQVVQGKETFTSLEVNNELKNAGHGAGNITDAFTALQRRTPAHVRQVAKTGRNRQGRKSYKLTVAGVRAVEGMMGQTPDADGEAE